MIQTLDHRNFREPYGAGEERGQIFPPDLEPKVFALQPGEVDIVEMETAFHVVRVAERTLPGTRPFTDVKLQHEIRKEIEHLIGQREYRKLVESLWTKAQPNILIDVGK